MVLRQGNVQVSSTCHFTGRLAARDPRSAKQRDGNEAQNIRQNISSYIS